MSTAEPRTTTTAPRAPARSRARAFAFTACIAALAPGCAEDTDPPAAPTTTTNVDRHAEPTSPTPGNRAPTATDPPVDLPATAAGQAAQGLQPHFALDAAATACLADHLADHPDQITDNPAADSPSPAVIEAATNCAATHTYLPELLATIDAQHDLTPTQHDCLAAALAELDAADLTTIALAGQLPDGSTLTTIAEACLEG